MIWSRIIIFFKVTYIIPYILLLIANILIVQMKVFGKPKPRKEEKKDLQKDIEEASKKNSDIKNQFKILN